MREHSEVGAVNSLICFACLGVSSAMEHIFNENAMPARTQARNCLAKATKASRGPRVSPQSQTEENVTMENLKGSPKEPKVRSKFPKAQATVRHRKLGSSEFEKIEIRNKLGKSGITSDGTTGTSLIHKEWSLEERNNDWSLDVWNDERSCVGWHEDYERMCCTTASSFSLGTQELQQTYP